MRSALAKAACIVTAPLVLAWLVVAWSITDGPVDFTGSADAAVVLGAAAWWTRPSPVYRERLNEAVKIYKSGRVQRLILTGGGQKPGYPAEGQVGTAYVIAQGVPPWDVFTETGSHSTYGNLLAAKGILEDLHLKTIVVVSDPMHMKRALAIASDLGLQARAAPTTTSLIQSTASRASFLWRETWLYIEYMLLGHREHSGQHAVN